MKISLSNQRSMTMRNNANLLINQGNNHLNSKKNTHNISKEKIKNNKRSNNYNLLTKPNSSPYFSVKKTDREKWPLPSTNKLSIDKLFKFLPNIKFLIYQCWSWQFHSQALIIKLQLNVVGLLEQFIKLILTANRSL